jgi:serine/threonine-protein kinase RsbW
MKSNGDTDKILISLRVDKSTVRRATQQASDFCAANHIATEAAQRIAIIVEELVANIVDHGRTVQDTVVTLLLERVPGETQLVLSDFGMAFDPRDWLDVHDVPPDRGGGAGLALVRKWATIEKYERLDGRNEVQLLVPDILG